MEMLLIMLPFMMAIGGVLLGLLVWAIRNNQFEDLEGEKHRIFFDDEDYAQKAAAMRR